MSDPQNRKVQIGQFSKMTRLSVKALRLYDAKGLLRPAHVDPSSGYRYYRLDQAYHAEIIRVLRSVDMPLDDIQKIIEAETDEVLSERLQRHQARLQKTINEQTAALAYLDTMVKNKTVVSPYKIALAEQPAQHIAALKIHTSLDKIANDIQAGFGTFMQGMGRAGVTPTSGPMILYHNVIDQESEGDIELVVPVGAAFTTEDEVYARELEAGTMATTIHKGSYAGMAQAYHALTHWVSTNGYDIVGPTREIYVNDPQTVAAEELLTRLEFPVCLNSDRAQ